MLKVPSTTDLILPESVTTTLTGEPSSLDANTTSQINVTATHLGLIKCSISIPRYHHKQCTISNKRGRLKSTNNPYVLKLNSDVAASHEIV